MDKAILGYCRLGYFRLGVYNDAWDKLKTRFETLGSTDVTRKRLMLGSRDSTTGWYAKQYEDIDIEAVIIPRAATYMALQAGLYVRLDALAITADPLAEGDKLKTATGQYYEVETVQEHYLGDSFWFRECDLTLLPFEDLTGGSYTESNVQDARYRTKVYLETYLSDSALPNYIVAYGNPDYPITRVFKEKGIDVVFSIGEPNSTPLMGHDQTPYGYEEHIPITIFCIDKSNITGTKLKWQAETELRRVLETYPLGSLRSLERRRDNDTRLGSTILYSTELILNYRRSTS